LPGFLVAGLLRIEDLPIRESPIFRLSRIRPQGLVNVVGADKVDVLVRNLAQARLEAAFGFIYAGIFGSQIAGLIQLQARRKVSIDEAHKFYLEAAAQKYPEVYAEYGFPGWLGFLKNHGLITQSDEDVAITDFGDDFVTWLRATRLNVNKAW
jgi:hypothetical protein